MMDILNLNRNPHDIADSLSLPLSKARAMVKACDFELAGWGRLSMQKHLISRRHVWDGWPSGHLTRFSHYRKLHDQGRVTMCQGRDGMFILQYAIPNERPVARDAYFYAERNY